MAETEKTPTLATLGEFGLIERLTGGLEMKQGSTLKGVGDDAAVIASGGEAQETQASQAFGRTWSNGRALIAYERYRREALPAAARDFAASADLRAFGGQEHLRRSGKSGDNGACGHDGPVAHARLHGAAAAVGREHERHQAETADDQFLARDQVGGAAAGEPLAERGDISGTARAPPLTFSIGRRAPSRRS